MPKQPTGGSTAPPSPTVGADDDGGADHSRAGGSTDATPPAATSTASPATSATTTPTAADGATAAGRNDGRSGGRSDGDNAAPVANGGGRALAARKQQFVIAPRQADGLQALGLQPLDFSALEQALRNSADIDVVDKVGPRSVLGALSDGFGGGHGVLVARMTAQKANALQQQGHGRLLIEHDQHLSMLEPVLRQPMLVTGVGPASTGPVFNAVVRVVGKDGAPVANAEVALFGSMLPANGATDANGLVTLSLFGETPDTVSGLYVKPKADYWSFYQRDPDLRADEANVVVLRSLSEQPALAGFPRQRALEWGQKAMRLDQLPGHYRGAGIKIAIIDSGAATTHDNLHGIKAGFDVMNKKDNPDGWNQDALGHGSHCAGVIAAADIASGIRGFAPDAEIHVCKLFPGGQISQLIDALEYCIDKQIDVVNLSLGGAEVSEALEQQIIRARRSGIACIVAAGNSGGPVQYPASSPNVLAVAAIGKLDEFPADSYHAQTLEPNVDAYGYFTAKFSCRGPQIGVCGPGVAITSCVPPNNFAAWDGTSMAAPHITGLAALVLAHHADFQTPSFQARAGDRVERLFQIIRSSARRVTLGDQSRIGFGLPDVLVAVGLQASAQQPAMAPQSMMSMQALEPFGMELARAPWLAARTPPWYPMPTMPPPYRQLPW
jgi:subtilisin family serine protease